MGNFQPCMMIKNLEPPINHADQFLFFLELKSFNHISTDVRLQSKAKALATRSGTIFVQIDPTPNSRTQAAHS
jgi:hypothetical protein